MSAMRKRGAGRFWVKKSSGLIRASSLADRSRTRWRSARSYRRTITRSGPRAAARSSSRPSAPSRWRSGTSGEGAGRAAHGQEVPAAGAGGDPRREVRRALARRRVRSVQGSGAPGERERTHPQHVRGEPVRATGTSGSACRRLGDAAAQRPLPARARRFLPPRRPARRRAGGICRRPRRVPGDGHAALDRACGAGVGRARLTPCSAGGCSPLCAQSSPMTPRTRPKWEQEPGIKMKHGTRWRGLKVAFESGTEARLPVPVRFA
jgi:hypothetical protein